MLLIKSENEIKWTKLYKKVHSEPLIKTLIAFFQKRTS